MVVFAFVFTSLGRRWVFELLRLADTPLPSLAFLDSQEIPRLRRMKAVKTVEMMIWLPSYLSQFGAVFGWMMN